MVSGSLRIRAAGLADIDALVDTRVALLQELSPGAGDVGRSSFREACRESLSQALGDGGALAWVAAAHDGEIHASAVLLLFPRLPSPTSLAITEGYLLNVYVAPAARRQGIAAALVAASLDEARRRGLARVRLHATPAGRGVYERLGFRSRADEMEIGLEGGGLVRALGRD